MVTWLYFCTIELIAFQGAQDESAESATLTSTEAQDLLRKTFVFLKRAVVSKDTAVTKKVWGGGVAEKREKAPHWRVKAQSGATCFTCYRHQQASRILSHWVASQRHTVKRRKRGRE